MKMLVAFAAALLSVTPATAQTPTAQAAEEEPVGESCPPLTAEQLEEHKRHHMSESRQRRQVAALVGVDALGRVLMAIDYDRNETADELVLFTARQRLDGPWSELVRSASIDGTSGTLRFEARDRSVAIALAVYPADLPKLKGKGAAFKRVIQQSGGHELVRNRPDQAYGRLLSSFDHNLIDSWPESFRDDLVVPGTTAPISCYNCDYTTCRIGGCHSAGCGMDCTGLIVNDHCSITCNTARSFGCCNCTNGIIFPVASCRCVACRRLIGPMP